MVRPNTAIEIGEACVPNIGLRGRRRRLRDGIGWLSVTVALAAVLMSRDAGPWWQLLLFPGWTLAALGWFQAKEKT